MTHREHTTATTRWDAGDMGCGRLAVGLHRCLAGLRNGDWLELTARDAGAAADIPSWCRLSGHRLASAQPPHYLIQKIST